MAAKVVGVIPARLDSKRFYGKVIYSFRGRPLLYYLYSEISKSKVIDQVIIATDSKKVQEVAEGFGAMVVMTSRGLKCGTDRVAETAERTGGDIFLNIQGDVFGLRYSSLDKAVKEFKRDSTAEFGTLARKMDSDSELMNPDSVKVVLKEDNNAGWFSRYPIPYLRQGTKSPRTEQFDYYFHIGVYMFKRAALKQFQKWPPTPHEKAESLEQLRILENGKNIKVYLTKSKTVSVDTPGDLKKLKEVFN